MADLTIAIPQVRASVLSILRLRPQPVQVDENGKPMPKQFLGNMVGSAFCIVRDKYLLTAYHIFNGDKARDPNDEFYAFVVPDNGDPAYHFPVAGFPLERADIDMAAIEIDPCSEDGVTVPPLRLDYGNQVDGRAVVTVGFPAPEIVQLTVDAHGNYAGGQFFLKSHANEGIISAQYKLSGILVYELNVGWHHGESGGPIATLSNEPAVFSIMQHYRNVQAPSGIVAGPHRGVSLAVIKKDLDALGAAAA